MEKLKIRHYQSLIAHDFKGDTYYAAVLKIDNEGTSHIDRRYVPRFFKTVEAAENSTSEYIAGMME